MLLLLLRSVFRNLLTSSYKSNYSVDLQPVTGEMFFLRNEYIMLHTSTLLNSIYWHNLYSLFSSGSFKTILAPTKRKFRYCMKTLTTNCYFIIDDIIKVAL